MNRSDHGQKHTCPECAIKYYDLKKEIVLCPKCGAKPAVAKVSRAAAQAARKPSRTPFVRSL